MRTAVTTLSFLILFLAATPCISRAEPEQPREHALRRLHEAGISQSLLTSLHKDIPAEDRDRIVQLNVLGFLGKADYSGHYSQRAIRKCLEFLRRHRKKLARIEKSSGVSKEVIAALLWVETKHGKLTGRHSVADVYFSLLQADHPEIIKATLVALAERAPSEVEQYRQKAIDRSYAKANWALRELKSLDEMLRNTAHVNRRPPLNGSYAGAFGIPQFIPSSYLQWARTSHAGRTPDLFNMEDAIQSVAFYLKTNGWKPDDPASHQAALFHYNRAQGYVDVILKLAECLKTSRQVVVKKSSGPAHRVPAIEGSGPK